MWSRRHKRSPKQISGDKRSERKSSLAAIVAEQGCSAKPISQKELRLLQELEVETREGWKILPAKVPAHPSADVKLFSHESNRGGATATELRAFLTLPVAANDVFAYVYSGAFLNGLWPTWGFEVTSTAAAGCNDLTRITSGSSLELLHWRRLSEDEDSGAKVWLLRPADAACMPDYSSRSRRASSGFGGSLADFLCLSDIVIGFVLRPRSTSHDDRGAGCSLFLYIRLPGTGFMLRQALARFCPGPLKRLANELSAEGAARGAAAEAEESVLEEFSALVSAIADAETPERTPSEMAFDEESAIGTNCRLADLDTSTTLGGAAESIAVEVSHPVVSAELELLDMDAAISQTSELGEHLLSVVEWRGHIPSERDCRVGESALALSPVAIAQEQSGEFGVGELDISSITFRPEAHGDCSKACLDGSVLAIIEGSADVDYSTEWLHDGAKGMSPEKVSPHSSWFSPADSPSGSVIQATSTERLSELTISGTTAAKSLAELEQSMSTASDFSPRSSSDSSVSPTTTAHANPPGRGISAVFTQGQPIACSRRPLRAPWIPFPRASPSTLHENRVARAVCF